MVFLFGYLTVCLLNILLLKQTIKILLFLKKKKNWLNGKDPEAGKDWRQEKRMTEDEMVGWHHRLDEHEFEQAPRLLVDASLMDREAWHAPVHGVAKSWTWLSDWTELIWLGMLLCV